MRALATLILGIGMLWLGREFLNGQLDHVKTEIQKPADVPEMKPAYDAEKFKDFEIRKGIGKSVISLNGGRATYSAPAQGSEPSTDLSSYEN